MTSGGHVQIEQLVKHFGDFIAVDDISITMPAGQFFSLLGPSGCGKTTTLRMIAGFETPTTGRILIDGTDVAGLTPNRRNVNTVFQSYALFPHLSVFDNVAFGLRRKHVSRAEIRQRVGRILEMVELDAFASRRPARMSGGQQQRVALARALVCEPAVLLLDEPLGALDAKLRKNLQLELKTLQQNVGITFVYVTHDQEEALTMNDQIAVMNGGKVEQIGPPEEVYERPNTTFVADFLGTSNLIDIGGQRTDPSGTWVTLGDQEVFLDQPEIPEGASRVVIRPERVQVEAGVSTGLNHLVGQVAHTVYLGNSVKLVVQLHIGVSVHALLQNTGSEIPFRAGDHVTVVMPPSALRALRDTGVADHDDSAA